MNQVVGVELNVDVVRAVALDPLSRGRRKTFEASWDPSRPSELVALLRTQLGGTRRIALSVGLGFLHPKVVNLPPAPPAERLRMLALEPDRFFPVQDQRVVVTLASDENVAFAVDADLLERWIEAFEVWAPVDSVEAAPFCLARALTASRRGGEQPAGAFAVLAGPDESGVVEIHEGRVHSARRLLEGMLTGDAQTLPALHGVTGIFLGSLGAALGVDGGLETMLLAEPQAGRIRRRRVQRLSLTAAVCAVALFVGLWSLDRSRQRTLDRLGDELAALAASAQPAEQLQERLTALDREADAIATLSARRMDPLRVLAALSQQLPAGATVLNIRSKGAEWQIDGTAREAAAIVPLLDGDDRFQDVRFLSASSRFRDGNRTLETFSIAFHVRPGT